MLNLQVEGMTCGHCERTVTKAVQSVDPAAKVAVDRSSGQVAVDSAGDPQAVRQAIEAEGYTVR